MIGALDKVEIVLDGNDGIAVVNEAVEYGNKLGHVLSVKSRGGLVQDVDGLARRALGKLGCKLYSLRLTAGKRGGGLSNLDISETYVLECAQLSLKLRKPLEEVHSLLYGHL